ncbi:MAG: DUF6497 family protein [Gemmobacter sp.]|jgi:hypothetical protein|nr:DUF6497 family protein [Gemmobacter sp.]
MSGTAEEEAKPGTVLLTGDGGRIAVPSGQPVTLQDVIWNEMGPQGLTMRFRFIAPQIAREGGGVDFDTAAADMQALCESFALPRLAEFGPMPAQIVISLADISVPFGEAAPEATQYFEAFSIRDGACIWEIY